MKKALLGALAAVGIIAVAGVALAVMRPDLLPAWAKPPAQAQVADSGPFCEEHGVPEKFCTLCHPELKEKLLLCPEHGNIPEDICTLCHPDVKKKYNIETCRARPAQALLLQVQGESGEKGDDQASANLINDGWCAEFGEAGPGRGRSGASSSRSCGSRRRSSRPTWARRPPVAEEEHAHELIANAETAYDANRYAEITPRVSGSSGRPGSTWARGRRPGEVLAVVDSAEVSTAKAQYSRPTRPSSSPRTPTTGPVRSTASEAVAGKAGASRPDRPEPGPGEPDGRRAEAQELPLRRRRPCPNPEDQATRGPSSTSSTPIDGTVVLRHAVLGRGRRADDAALHRRRHLDRSGSGSTSTSRTSPKVEPGQAVDLRRLGGGPDEEPATFAGKVTWVGTEVDETDPDDQGPGRAREPRREAPGQPVRPGRDPGRREPHKAVVVPKGAVQRNEKVDLVFLPRRPASTGRSGSGEARRPGETSSR